MKCMKKLRKKPIFVKNESEISACAKNMNANTICPIFELSNVTGAGLDNLKSFLFKLKERLDLNINIQSEKDPAVFDIHENFLISGIGIVISGIMKSGVIKVN